MIFGQLSLEFRVFTEIQNQGAFQWEILTDNTTCDRPGYALSAAKLFLGIAQKRHFWHNMHLLLILRQYFVDFLKIKTLICTPAQQALMLRFLF